MMLDNILVNGQTIVGTVQVTAHNSSKGISGVTTRNTGNLKLSVFSRNVFFGALSRSTNLFRAPFPDAFAGQGCVSLRLFITAAFA